jgi:predicted transcriptional regulator
MLGMKSNLTNDLRAAVRNCGKSANQLSKLTGVPHPTITRFLAGVGLRLSTAEKLADYLGLKFTPHKNNGSTRDK